jgi:hypothetical protein
MAITYIGSLSFAALTPLVYGAIGTIGVSLNASLQGNLALNASLSVSPPTLATTLIASAEFTAQLAIALAAFPPVPNISFSVSDCVNLSASLNASFGLLVTLDALLSAAVGIYSYGYVGAGSSMGAAVTTALATHWPDGAPTNTSTNAMIFGATSSVAQTQIGLFLGGCPFTGGLAYGGRLGLSGLSKVTAKAVPQGNAGISAQLSATASLQASLSVSPPSIVQMIEANAKFYANLSAQVTVPDVKFALAATAQAAAHLSAKFGFLCQLGACFEQADATLFCYTYSGLGNAMGADLTTELASTWGDGMTPTSGSCSAAILGATDSLTYSAMTSFFGGI